MIRHRWLMLVGALQMICLLIVMNRPTGSDWAVFVILVISMLICVEGFYRIERRP